MNESVCGKPKSAEDFLIRKACLPDMPAVKKMIDKVSADASVLPRTLIELCESVRDFHLCETGGELAGCCALHVDMQNLAEVRTLIILDEFRDNGLGGRLLQACLREARVLGVERVYALTRIEGFFLKHDFTVIDKHDLPSKVFRDCVRCPKFPDCDETAVVYDIGPKCK